MRISPRIALLSLGLLACSCGREPVPVSSGPSEVVVAEVGNERITLAQLEAEMARRSAGISPAFVTRAQREAVLEELIRRKAALVKARELRLDQDPRTEALIEQLIVSRFIESQFSNAAATEPVVGDAEVEQFYRDNSDAYRVPTGVRCGVIVLKLGSKAEPGRREELKARALQLQGSASGADAQEFARLVQAHSEDQSTRYIGGDTGWLQKGDAASRWPEAVVEAAMGLSRPGEVAPLVETASGFLIVRLIERKEGGLRPLAEVSESIRYQLARLKRQEHEQAFFNDLKQGVRIRVNQEAIDALPPPASTSKAGVPRLPGG